MTWTSYSHVHFNNLNKLFNVFLTLISYFLRIFNLKQLCKIFNNKNAICIFSISMLIMLLNLITTSLLDPCPYDIGTYNPCTRTSHQLTKSDNLWYKIISYQQVLLHTVVLYRLHIYRNAYYYISISVSNLVSIPLPTHKVLSCLLLTRPLLKLYHTDTTPTRQQRQLTLCSLHFQCIKPISNDVTTSLLSSYNSPSAAYVIYIGLRYNFLKRATSNSGHAFFIPYLICFFRDYG